MTEGKYVITLDGEAKIFSKDKIHAYKVCDCPDLDCGGRAVSAGFFEIRDGAVKTFGESTSIGVQSRPEDAQIIAPLLTSL